MLEKSLLTGPGSSRPSCNTRTKAFYKTLFSDDISSENIHIIILSPLCVMWDKAVSSMKSSYFFRSPTSWIQLIDSPSFHPLALSPPRPLLSANEWALQRRAWWHISVGLFLLECRTPTHIFGLRTPHLLAPNSLRLSCCLRLFLPVLLPFPVPFPGPRLALSGACPCYSYFLPFLLSRRFFSKIFYMSNPTLVFCSWKTWTNLETKEQLWNSSNC